MLRDLLWVMGQIGQPHYDYKAEVMLMRVAILMVVFVAVSSFYSPLGFVEGMLFGTAMTMVFNGLGMIRAKRDLRMARLNSLIGWRHRRVFREQKNNKGS